MNATKNPASASTTLYVGNENLAKALNESGKYQTMPMEALLKKKPTVLSPEAADAIQQTAMIAHNNKVAATLGESTVPTHASIQSGKSSSNALS